MVDLIIRYEWKSKANILNSYALIVNMTKKQFYAYKFSNCDNKKNLTIHGNNTSDTVYWIGLKDKASFKDLVSGLRKSDFEEI